MSNPYRQDAAVIRERHEAVARELTETERTLDRLTTERGVLRRELENLERRLPQPPLTALDTLQVASPCAADWRKMVGDERVRMCAECNKNVYDISAMTEAEALAFLAKDGGACVRFYRRADGRVMTSDCPVGVIDKRKRLRILAVCSVPLVAASVAGLGAAAGDRHQVGQVVERVSPEVQQGARFNQGYVMANPRADALDELRGENVRDAKLREDHMPVPSDGEILPPPPK
jgi:hypothetical protein